MVKDGDKAYKTKTQTPSAMLCGTLKLLTKFYLEGQLQASIP
jgi:hypothetical protein